MTRTEGFIAAAKSPMAELAVTSAFDNMYWTLGLVTKISHTIESFMFISSNFVPLDVLAVLFVCGALTSHIHSKSRCKEIAILHAFDIYIYICTTRSCRANV